jgi:sulfur-carrier protein adenylyltransferase/sulfurtransferase
MHAIDESVYYGRHFRLPGFSAATQQKLRDARVLVVGMGGLGCPVALYLAGAGVGTLALCDADEVSLTNLHRQVLFDTDSIGQKKVHAAAKRLRAINPNITIIPMDMFADEDLLPTLVGEYDLVVDGTDNFSAKFAINDACQTKGVPLVYGSIFQYEGKVSVFHYKGADGQQPAYSYRDLFPEPPPAGLSQNCGEAGVIGVLPGIIGTLQAAEAIKLITGLGETLSGQLLTFDALTATTRKLGLSKRAIVQPDKPVAREDLSYDELVRLQAGPNPPMLLDVRDLGERQAGSLGGLHIAMPELPSRLSELPRNAEIVVYCKSGVRSSRAALFLRSVLPDATILNLRGGVDAASGGITCA